MAERPDAVVFDVLETLLDVDALSERLEQVGQSSTVLEKWFMRFQRDAMALTLAGDEAPFKDVAREAMRTEAGKIVPGFDQVTSLLRKSMPDRDHGSAQSD